MKKNDPGPNADFDALLAPSPQTGIVAKSNPSLLNDRARFESQVLEPIRAIVGDRGVITDRATMQPMMESWRDNWVGRVPLVVLPATTEELAAVVRVCAATRTPIVPQGGNTGLTGGSQPHANDSEIVISTTRMNHIREIDVDNDTITVEAGCVLANIQHAAREAGRLFPLSLGAEGTCQIGGNISTNAGGVQVVRYGNMRNLVTGLEVVLPDGRVWNGLRGLRKDNAGYDMKQMFIGAEGTIGIISAATLRLLPLLCAKATAFLAVSSPGAAVAWFRRAKASLGERITAIEILERRCLEIARKHNETLRDPLSTSYPWYLLVELSDQTGEDDLVHRLEQAFDAGLEAGETLDGVIASSHEQAAMLWRLREGIPEGQKREGYSFKHDISVPISKVETFLGEADEALRSRFPGVRSYAFGHLGDGNIHYNPMQASNEPATAWAAKLPEVNRIVHDIVHRLGGSITAEHGIGRLRVGEIARYKPDFELEMMARVKRTFDPDNIMNPGKVIPASLLEPKG
jgi:FAD/FMN-containing dehydrogenase